MFFYFKYFLQTCALPFVVRASRLHKGWVA